MSCQLKMLNSSSKPECIGTARPLRMNVDHHLPRRFEDGCRAEALPILYVELAVQFAQPPVTLHDETRRCVAHKSLLSRAALFAGCEANCPPRYCGLWHVPHPPAARIFVWQAWQNTIFVAPNSSVTTSCSATAPWQSWHFVWFIK